MKNLNPIQEISSKYVMDKLNSYYDPANIQKNTDKFLKSNSRRNRLVYGSSGGLAGAVLGGLSGALFNKAAKRKGKVKRDIITGALLGAAGGTGAGLYAAKVRPRMTDREKKIFDKLMKRKANSPIYQQNKDRVLSMARAKARRERFLDAAKSAGIDISSADLRDLPESVLTNPKRFEDVLTKTAIRDINAKKKGEQQKIAARLKRKLERDAEKFHKEYDPDKEYNYLDVLKAKKALLKMPSAFINGLF